MSQKPNLIIVLLYIVMFLLLHWRQAAQSAQTWHDYPSNIMHCGHTWHVYPWLWVSLTWSLYNMQLWLHGRWFRKFTVRFRPINAPLRRSTRSCLLRVTPALHWTNYSWKVYRQEYVLSFPVVHWWIIWRNIEGNEHITIIDCQSMDFIDELKGISNFFIVW